MINKKEMEKFLSDFDNLIECKVIKNEEISDFTHYHKGMNLYEFLAKGREIIREAYNSDGFQSNQWILNQSTMGC